MSLKVVLDTNVVISAHLNPDGMERLVLHLALSPLLSFFVTPDILAEYRAVLHRKKFNINPQLLQEMFELLQSKATVVFPPYSVTASSDPDDNRFLESAQAAKADYLVTSNKRHFPKRWKHTRVVNAREFLEIVGPGLFSE